MTDDQRGFHYGPVQPGEDNTGVTPGSDFHYGGTRDELKAEIVAAVLEALKIQAEAIADRQTRAS